MPLSKEEIENFKKKIILNIETNFPEERKAAAVEKIKSMNDNEFIEFLKNNDLIESEKEGKENRNNNSTPFRMIIEEKIPSYKIQENKEAVAVLEINPISEGHTIVIPKKPIADSKKITKEIISLANKVAKTIKNKLKPKEVSISPSSVLGEIIINILPIYTNETINSNKKQISQEKLEELKKILETKPKLKKEKKPTVKKINTSKIIIPRRIP
ncbi:MAG: HIT domain protein [Candidatus Diapherotrites archaeon ADurb.Bin253]|jgi:histidine triad (HIT) family protein|nr:HIT domain-containing protein [Candidatus Pacearchaeota archaeon]OQA69162.1 MAG: HIT domain protein [Candidatus Diapherotrites archaeon ADurb.Bin253]HNZ51978.1 HIT domain-containing protein [Candidatus Pacearchaeota archaeon]HOC96683.1 HIT domain-containing protein [Candidatus Pacearchaeota archaeon]HOH04057.1 HIT domain-containing protein [Candidatus Pacearchaeota archaeon]